MAYLPNSRGSYIALILIISCSFLSSPYPCSAGELISHNCSRGDHYSSNTRYKYNLDILLNNMTSQSSKTGFYEQTEETGGGDQTVYGSYLCQGDLTHKNCSNCIQSAVTGILNNCSNQIKAQIWYDECILTFSDEPFFGTWQQDYMTWCGYGEYFKEAEFDSVLSDTLTKVANQAANDETPGRKFATMEVNLTFVNESPTMYTLAQCVPDLSSETCLECLTHSITNDLPQWCNRTRSGRTLSSSCIVRYEMNRFYSDDYQVPSASPPALPPIQVPALMISPAYTPQKAKTDKEPSVIEGGASVFTGTRRSSSYVLGIVSMAIVMLLALGM